MKKAGLFLLSLVLVAGFIGCGGGDDDDDSIRIRIVLNALPCSPGPATGTITNTDTGWVSETLTVSPGGTLEVTLPEKGTYRFRFSDKTGYWDFYEQLEDGDTVFLTTDC